QGRGKIERFFGRVTSQFLAEITTDATSGVDAGAATTDTTDTMGPAGSVGSAVGSLDELNALFTSWIEVVYHRAIHSTTDQAPIQRWSDGWTDRRPHRKDPEVIAEAFRWSAHRTVSKSATVSLHSNTYQV